MHIKIQDGNISTLAKLEPNCMTPYSKNYVMKYHPFHEQLESRKIELVKVNAKVNQGDKFTYIKGH